MQLINSQKPRRNFRYAFDRDGYYAGLVRADRATGLPVFPPYSTDQEPYWKEGFRPRFNFDLNSWTLEPRGEKELRLAVEKEILQKFSDRVCSRISDSEAKWDLIIGSVLETVRKHSALTDDYVEKVFLQLQDWLELKYRIQNNLVSEKFRIIDERITDLIEVLIESEKRSLELLNRPGFLERNLRRFFMWFSNILRR